jgi:hypothetical protein
MKIVQEKKRVQLGDMLVAEGPFQMNPGALDGRFALENLRDLSQFVHGILPYKE